ERDVEQMAEIVVVPRVARLERERAPIERHGGAVVAEQRLRERHQRVGDVVVRLGREDLPQVERRGPWILLEVQLREVAMREHPVWVALRRDLEDALEKRLDDTSPAAFVHRALGATP